MKNIIFKNLSKLLLALLLFTSSNVYAKYRLGIKCDGAGNQILFHAYDIHPGEKIYRLRGSNLDGSLNFLNVFPHPSGSIKTKLVEINDSIAVLKFYNQDNTPLDVVLQNETPYGKINKLVISNMPDQATSDNWSRPCSAKVYLESYESPGNEMEIQYPNCTLEVSEGFTSWQGIFSNPLN